MATDHHVTVSVTIDEAEIIRDMIAKQGLLAVLEMVADEAEQLADPTSDGGTGAECYFGLSALDDAIAELEHFRRAV